MKKHVGLSIIFILLFLLCAGFLLTGIIMGWFMTKDTVVPPTCTEQGYTVRNGYFNKESILFYTAPLGHNYEAEVTEPTCTEGGSTLFTCRDCGDSYVGAPTEPKGHSYAHRIIAPSCTIGGFTENTCRDCGHTFRDKETAPTGHIEVPNVIAPTCTEEGYTNYTCTVCAHIRRDDVVPALQHMNITETIIPTCVTPGYSLTVCQRCAAAELIDPQEALGHDYHDYITHPTCTTAGYTTYICSRCHDSYTEDYVDPRGHNYIVTTLAATQTKAGGKVHTCSRCGDAHMTDVYTFAEVFDGRQGDGSGPLSEGVDLSHHNGEVNFEALKEAGISFVILRLGTSRTPDEMFETYYEGARAAGLDIGAYLYTYADSIEAAHADAAWVIERLQGKTFEYPIFFDIEDEALSILDSALLTEISLTFCEDLVEAGYYPGVYTNKRWMADHLDIERIRKTYDIWLASWIVTGENISDYSDDYAMWQYTATGEVEGVATPVDRNRVYREYPSFIQKYGYNGFGQAQ